MPLQHGQMKVTLTALPARVSPLLCTCSCLTGPEPYPGSFQEPVPLLPRLPRLCTGSCVCEGDQTAGSGPALPQVGLPQQALPPSLYGVSKGMGLTSQKDGQWAGSKRPLCTLRERPGHCCGRGSSNLRGFQGWGLLFQAGWEPLSGLSLMQKDRTITQSTLGTGNHSLECSGNFLCRLLG